MSITLKGAAFLCVIVSINDSSRIANKTMSVQPDSLMLGRNSWQWQEVTWLQPPAHPHLHDGAVHVWRLATDTAVLAVPATLARLSVVERERAGRIQCRERYEAYLGVRILLHELSDAYAADLMSRHDEEPTDEVDEIVLQPRALRPTQRLYASVSHSGGVVAVALAREPVGIDIQQLRDVAQYPNVAARLFPPHWTRALADLAHDSHERSVFFCRCWTALEALYKLRGRGLLRNMALREIQGQDQPLVAGAQFFLTEDIIAASAMPKEHVVSCYDADSLLEDR